MGSPDDEPERFEDEGPQHKVRISEGFWLADTACTQALWQALMGENPSYFEGDEQLPVEQVSFDDVGRFLKRLQELLPEHTAAELPSEAQWEYACRAGTDAPFSFGANITPELVNYNGLPYAGGEHGPYRERTVPVKHLPANAWGLYQMHGNVLEWCRDDLRDYTSAAAGQAELDPLGDLDSPVRALRGGAWFSVAGFARCACRDRGGRGSRDHRVGVRLSLRS